MLGVTVLKAEGLAGREGLVATGASTEAEAGAGAAEIGTGDPMGAKLWAG